MAEPAPSQATTQAGVCVGELFEEHGRMVYALCRLILRDRVEAEDAAQQTFLSAYRSLLRGGGPEQPAAWLATIARNECRGRIAGRATATFALSYTDGQPGADPTTIVDQREEIEALCSAIAELPRGQREAIVLREFYGLSYAEVAAALGVSGPAVESALFKSRRRLQDRLRSLRTAANLAAVPVALRESLAQAVPGFAQGGGGAAATATASKLALPVTIKAAGIVAAALAVGGTVTVATTEHHRVPAVVASAQAAMPSAGLAPERQAAPAHQFAAVAQPAQRASVPAPSRVETTASEQEHNDGGGQAENRKQRDGERSDTGKSSESGRDHSSDEGATASAPPSGDLASQQAHGDGGDGADGRDLAAQPGDGGDAAAQGSDG